MTLATIDRYDPDRASRVGRRAVVVGGSVAGLCAARVLADAFEDVVVLERDPFPDEPTPRDGAPQTGQPHVMLEAGRATLEDLFPGFSEGVVGGGGLLLDASTEMREYNRGGFVASPPDPKPLTCASRGLFEHVVRRKTRRVDGVDLRGNCQFVDYLTGEDGAAVTGLRYRDPGGTERTLSADLVVDATGRTSRTPSWLADHGFAEPPTDEVTVDVAYSSVSVDRPEDDRRMLLAAPEPPQTRGGGLFPSENGRWEVTLQGVHGDAPPADPEGFLEFAESLPVPDVAELLRSRSWHAEEASRYPYPASRRRRYEDLDTFPDGLVVTGDAVASFNPVYGQGMSVAALDAVLLHHALVDGGLDGLAGRFFGRVGDLVDVVWRLAVGGDFAFPQTSGPKPPGTDLANWYVDRLVRRAHSDPALSEAFARVTRLEEPPETLFRPGVAWRVLRPGGGTPDGSLVESAARTLSMISL